MTFSTPTDRGRYDDMCTEVREKLKATGVCLLVFDTRVAPAFSVQGEILDLVKMPAVLRFVASEIEKDLREVARGNVPKDNGR